MRVWFLADLHFGCRADNEIWLKDYSDYFYNVFIPLLKDKDNDNDESDFDVPPFLRDRSDF